MTNYLYFIIFCYVFRLQKLLTIFISLLTTVLVLFCILRFAHINSNGTLSFPAVDNVCWSSDTRLPNLFIFSSTCIVKCGLHDYEK